MENRRQHGEPLNRERVLRAAMAVVDADGLDKLTMRRLGAELGVDPMMIYRLFPSKSAVVDGLMESIWGAVDIGSITRVSDWREQLVLVMHGLRQALLEHPHAILIIGTRPAAGPGLFQLLEQILAVLAEAGMVIRADTADLLNALVNYTVGHVLAEVAAPVGGPADTPAGGRDSGPLLDPNHMPHLASLLGTGWSYDAHRQYDRALRSLIGGWPEDWERAAGT